MINLIDTVGNALKADITLTSLVSGRVHWIKPATKSPPPYVTYFEVNNSESGSADDLEYANDIEIQVDIWASGSTIPIAKVVQKVMRGLGFIHQAMPDLYEDATQIFHKPIRFTITKEV
jgi:hypothetical protein